MSQHVYPQGITILSSPAELSLSRKWSPQPSSLFRLTILPQQSRCLSPVESTSHALETCLFPCRIIPLHENLYPPQSTRLPFIIICPSRIPSILTNHSPPKPIPFGNQLSLIPHRFPSRVWCSFVIVSPSGVLYISEHPFSPVVSLVSVLFFSLFLSKSFN